jgi:carboxymethylenebutenolidase
VTLVDLFRGKLARDRDEAHFLTQQVQRNDVLECMSGGLKILRERLGPGAPIGSMGFCMGGGFALLAACNLDLFFCVDYYGMIQDAQETRTLKGPVILILGSEDKRVTPWAIQQLLPAMVVHQKRIDVHLYPNAAHAFHRPGWEGHSPLSAADAWQKTLAFLHRFHDQSPKGSDHWATLG